MIINIGNVSEIDMLLTDRRPYHREIANTSSIVLIHFNTGCTMPLTDNIFGILSLKLLYPPEPFLVVGVYRGVRGSVHPCNVIVNKGIDMSQSILLAV